MFIKTFLFCLLVVLIVCNVEADNILGEAERQMSLDNYQQAETLYLLLWEADKDNVIALEGLLTALSRQEKYERIVSFINEHKIDTVSANLWKAYAKYMTGNLIGSMNEYQAVLNTDFYNSIAAAGQGWNYLHFGRYSRAEKLFERSLESLPNYEVARNGIEETRKNANHFFAQAALYYNKDIAINPVIYNHFSRNQYRLFLVVDYVTKDIDYLIDGKDKLQRTAYSGGFRAFYNKLALGGNIFYLTSNEETMYDAQGLLLLLELSQLTPFSLLDYGLSLGLSEYRFGKANQMELYGRFNFNKSAVKPSVTMINYEDEVVAYMEYWFPGSPAKKRSVVTSVAYDYYVSNYVTVTLSGSYGEKNLLIDREGAIIDKLDMPQWDGGLAVYYRKDRFHYQLGSRFDADSLLTFFTVFGITINL